MDRKWFNSIITGLLVGLMQVVFVNGIRFYGLFNPKVYPIFLLLLPRNIKPTYLMIIGFLYGAIIDFLCHTQGIGMSASVFICFIKPYILRLLYNKSEEDEEEINFAIQGSAFLTLYLTISLFIFHIYYFFVELGEISNIIYIFSKSVLSTILAMVLYGVFYLMFISVPKKK